MGFTPDSAGFTPDEPTTGFTPDRLTAGGIAQQFTTGLINEALLGFPLFTLQQVQGEGAVAELESDITGERIARGVGTTAGFLIGAPAKVFIKGGQLGLRALTKILPKLAKVGKAQKQFTKGQRALRATVSGGAGFGALETVSAPEKDFTEKLTTVPLAITIGTAFGVAGEALKPVVSRFISKVTGGKKSVFTDELANDVLTEVDRIKQKATSLIQSGKLEKAQVFINQNLNQKVREQFQKAIIDKAIIAGKDVSFIPIETIEHLNLVKKATPFDGFMTSARTYMESQGPVARSVVKILDDIVGTARRRTGDKVVQYARLKKGLSDKQLDNFVNVIEGKAAPEGNQVAELANFWTKEAQAISQEAKQVGVQITGRGGEVFDFKPRENFFPHIILNPDAPRKVVKKSLQSAVDRGAFKNIKEAKLMWESYSSFVKVNKGGGRIIKSLVDSGQAKTTREAEQMLRTFAIKSKSRTFGNLERPREINLPFWDTNVDRVLPQYFEGAFHRLETIKRFGAKDEMKGQILAKIKEQGGDSAVVETVINRMTGVIERPSLPGIDSNFLGKVRSFQTITKLGLAAIPNSTQSINTAYLTGLKNTMKGIRAALSGKGKEFADSIGVTLQSTVDDIIRQSTGGGTGFTSAFLRKTGFTFTERLNRTIAANAGKTYVLEMSGKLLRNPSSARVRRALSEIKIDPDKILRQGGAQFDDIVKGAQTVVKRTQFESTALELPIFFTSPGGKVITQFKTFAFNQSKLIKDAILKEAGRGNFAPMITAITLMPILGEGVRDVRALLSGKVRDKQGLARIAENMAAVGGWGIVSDLLSSANFGGVAEFFGGPTGSDLAGAIEAIVLAAKGKPKRLAIETVEKAPVIGPLLRNIVANR